MPEKDMHPNVPHTVGENSKPLTICKAALKNPQAAEESLIYAVYKRKPLWDPTVHFYRNNTVVKLLWDEVAQETGLTDMQARTRWKSLRDYYRIELKKIYKAGGKEFKKSAWVYFQSMSFLEELMGKTRSASPRNSEHSEESLSASEESIEAAESLLSISSKESKTEIDKAIKNEHFNLGDDEVKVENVDNRWEEQKLEVADDHPVVKDTSTGMMIGGFRNSLKMRPNFDLMHRKLMIQLENRRLELLERSARMEDDEDLLFFRSLLPLVRSLPESRRMWMRLKFQEIVCKEVQDLSQNTN